jgi:hypothetical protein
VLSKEESKKLKLFDSAGSFRRGLTVGGGGGGGFGRPTPLVGGRGVFLVGG